MQERFMMHGDVQLGLISGLQKIPDDAVIVKIPTPASQKEGDKMILDWYEDFFRGEKSNFSFTGQEPPGFSKLIKTLVKIAVARDTDEPRSMLIALAERHLAMGDANALDRMLGDVFNQLQATEDEDELLRGASIVTDLSSKLLQLKNLSPSY